MVRLKQIRRSIQNHVMIIVWSFFIFGAALIAILNCIGIDVCIACK